MCFNVHYILVNINTKMFNLGNIKLNHNSFIVLILTN